MNPIVRITQTVFIASLSVQALFADLVTSTSTASMSNFVTGTEKLTVYTNVPGFETVAVKGSTATPYPSRAKSDIYEIRVRSAATNNLWVSCFPNMTYNRGLEIPDNAAWEDSTTKFSYQNHTHGWTHTYANIEMSENSPVEVEIKKVGSTTLDGFPDIRKFAVHPQQKIIPGSSRLDPNGCVYFKIDKPCQVVIDINGQMDDHNAGFSKGKQFGAMGSPVHSIALYANPILTKPVASSTHRITTVQPSQSNRTRRLPTPNINTYDTLAFAPGVHFIGPSFQVHPGKSYYIPGDAILYGSMNNMEALQGTYRDRGDRIRIYGYGTLSGIQIPHWERREVNGVQNPEYPEFFAMPGPKNNEDRAIKLIDVWDTKVEGVSVSDPASFCFDIAFVNTDSCLVSWVKMHAWRKNGDGYGGYTKIEDSFIRACDDSTYVRTWRRRCTFWKDTNASIFRNIGTISGGIEDCDILYARWRSEGGLGSIFGIESYDDATPKYVDLKGFTMRNNRFHDKLCNPSQIVGIAAVETFKNLTFEDMTFYVPLNGRKSVLRGTSVAPYTGAVMFKNIKFQNAQDGSSPVRLTRGNYTDYFTVNEFVDPSIFEDAYSLTTSAENGRIVLDPPSGSYVPGTVVTVSACPAVGYTIGNWGGDLSGTANVRTITMDGNKSISASFIPANGSAQFTQPGTGTWTVPPNVYSATFHVWGGGGAGGSAHNHLNSTAQNTSLGGGGTGGSFSAKTLQVIPGQVIHYAIGAGGVGATLNTGENFPLGDYRGAGGGSFASLAGGESFVLAQGGLGGENVSSRLANDPRYALYAGNIGDVRYYGGNGADASNTITGSGGGSAGSLGDGGDAGINGPPGVAGLGGGALGGGNTGFINAGINGANPGGGGGGAAVRNSNTPGTFRKGGNGGAGQMIISYHASDSNLFASLTAQSVNGTIESLLPGPYPIGSTIRLIATPNAGYKFTGWSGDLSGNANEVDIVMNASKSVTANFTQVFTLESFAANGAITLSPQGGTYDFNTPVTVQANPSNGYRFTGWSGDLTGYVSDRVVVMDRNKSITANFELILPTEYRVNGGGPAYTALDGSTYSADNTVPEFNSTGTPNTPIANTDDDTLYKSQRYSSSSFGYNIPLENGVYQVTLMFAEFWHDAANLRTFDVGLEGAPVITNLDIWSKVGKNAAYNETHLATVTDRQLNITFTARINNAKISAIRVVPDPFTAWAGTGGNFNADANNDGMANGLAWLLGATDPGANTTVLPLSVSGPGSNLVLDFTCRKVANRGTAELKLQYSADLGVNDPWAAHEVAVPDGAKTVGAVTFSVPSVNPDPNLVNLRATIPASAVPPGTNLFARLMGER